MRRFLTRLAAVFVTAAAMSGATLVVATGAASAAVHDPIVFVHGYLGSAGNWDTMISRFKTDGYTAAELYAWNYDWSQSNTVIAGQLISYVEQVRSRTGAAKVDIVAHSMGGLNSRYYLKYLGGTGYVDDWASLGSPHHGTEWAYGCFTYPCREMRPGSAFLNNLNTDDETPGEVNYGSWWSPCDEIIEPKTSPVLSGARNTQTACIGHLALITNATVYAQVRDHVA